MGAGTQEGLNVLGVALVLGLLGDALLRATPWGLNVLLWVGAALGGGGGVRVDVGGPVCMGGPGEEDLGPREHFRFAIGVGVRAVGDVVAWLLEPIRHRMLPQQVLAGAVR